MTPFYQKNEGAFIATLQHFGYKKANTTFYISDPYTLFYLKFIEHAGKYEPNIWLNKLDDPAFRSWSGIAFEQVCLAHIAPIKKALGIAGVASTTSVWYLKGDKQQKGGQIDLVFDRRDQVINLFEIKFSINKFAITKEGVRCATSPQNPAV